MTELNKDLLKERLETVETSDILNPQRLDTLLEEDGERDRWRDEEYSEPRKTAPYIPDYWSLDPEVEQRFEKYMEELENPGLEGAVKATQAIEAQREKDVAGFSMIVGFRIDSDDNYNVNQFGAPQGVENLVELPEWMLDDDQFSDIGREGYVARIVDDHTVYARHIRDNVKSERPSSIAEAQFWKAYNETINSYLDWR